MIGIHVNKGTSASVAAAISKAEDEFKITAAQIFTHGPQGMRKNNTKLQGNSDVHLYCHAPYPSVGIWSDPDKYVDYMKSEFKEAERIGSRGIVFHLKDESVEVIVNSLARLHKKVKFNVPVLLEMPARSATPTSYDKPANLIALAKELSRLDFEWGFCIDTSHLWAAGHNLKTKKQMKDWLEDVPNIRLFHVNANIQKNFGTGKDLHIVPLAKEDAIWHEYVDDNFDQSGLHYLISYARKKNIDCIVEYNRGSKEDLRIFIEKFYSV